MAYNFTQTIHKTALEGKTHHSTFADETKIPSLVKCLA